jgi:hypothetical protein
VFLFFATEVVEQGNPGALVGEHLLPPRIVLGVPPSGVRPREGPALVEGRLQPIGWMARLLQFFQLLLAELGATRRRGSGWSVIRLQRIHNF